MNSRLVGDREQVRRNGKAERLGGLQVDDELEFGWLLDGQVVGLSAFENLADIISELLT
jgi:hypothetical protein